MIRIKVFASYDPNFDQKLFENLYNKTDERITFVNDNSYTHAIIINVATPLLTIPKENVIGLAWEPIEFLFLTPQFIEYAKKYISKYFIGKKGNLPEPFEESYGYLSHDWATTPFKTYDDKPGLMSLMVSHKSFLPGHRYRFQLASRIIKENLPVDIWGGGCEILKNFFPDSTQIKTKFENYYTLAGEYKFSIAIENTISPLYISEKITNCYVHNTIPIYDGAEKVDEVFGYNCCIKLTGNLDKDMEIIKNIIKNPDAFKIDVLKCREKLFEDKNASLFEYIKSEWLN